MKLHLGCGRDYKEGYINCDISPEVKHDKIVDLEKKLPFEDSEVDEIYTKNTLEHIKNIIPLIEEFHRICKNNAIINIRVPFYSSYAFYCSLQHVTRFTPDTFKGSTFRDSNLEKIFNDKYKIKYFVERKKGLLGVFQKVIDYFINKNTYFYCRVLANIFPSSEIEYILEVKK